MRSERQQMMRASGDYSAEATRENRWRDHSHYNHNLVVLRLAGGEDDQRRAMDRVPQSTKRLEVANDPRDAAGDDAASATTPAGANERSRPASGSSSFSTRTAGRGEHFRGMERRAHAISATIRSVSVERVRETHELPKTSNREATLSRNLSQALAAIEARGGDECHEGAPEMKQRSASVPRTRPLYLESTPSSSVQRGARGAAATGAETIAGANNSKLRIEMSQVIGGDKRRQRHFYRQARQFISVWDTLSNVGEIFERQDRAARHLASADSSTPSALQRLIENAVKRGGSIDTELLSLLHVSLPEKWSDSLMAGYTNWVRAQPSGTPEPAHEDAARLRKLAIRQLKAFFKYYARHADRIQCMLSFVLNQGNDAELNARRSRRSSQVDVGAT